MEYVIIGTEPVIGFYAGGRPAGIPDLSYQRLISLPIWRSPVYLAGGAENANGSVVLENGDGLLSALWSVPPLRQPLQVWSGAEILIEGVIVGIEIGAEVTVEFEA